MLDYIGISHLVTSIGEHVSACLIHTHKDFSKYH